MTYLCKSCGNSGKFYADQEETVFQTQDISIDGEGEILNYGDTETTDSETTDGGPNNIECSDCGSENVEWIEDEHDFNEMRQEILDREDKKKRINNWKQRLK